MDNLKLNVKSDIVDKNFLGTYLTENGSTAVVVSRSAMVVEGKKKVIWVGFVLAPFPVFYVWDKEGKSMEKIPASVKYDLKEAVMESAY